MFVAASTPDALNLDVSLGMWAILGGVILVMTAFDLVVKADPANATDFDRIADLPVDTPTAGQVPIRLLADVRQIIPATAGPMPRREIVRRMPIVKSPIISPWIIA